MWTIARSRNKHRSTLKPRSSEEGTWGIITWDYPQSTKAWFHYSRNVGHGDIWHMYFKMCSFLFWLQPTLMRRRAMVNQLTSDRRLVISPKIIWIHLIWFCCDSTWAYKTRRAAWYTINIAFNIYILLIGAHVHKKGHGN